MYRGEEPNLFSFFSYLDSAFLHTDCIHSKLLTLKHTQIYHKKISTASSLSKPYGAKYLTEMVLSWPLTHQNIHYSIHQTPHQKKTPQAYLPKTALSAIISLLIVKKNTHGNYQRTKHLTCHPTYTNTQHYHSKKHAVEITHSITTLHI